MDAFCLERKTALVLAKMCTSKFTYSIAIKKNCKYSFVLNSIISLVFQSLQFYNQNGVLLPNIEVLMLFVCTIHQNALLLAKAEADDYTYK